jgi:3-hydroxyacyl-[acyl-carrier-protein] dehydratase
MDLYAPAHGGARGVGRFALAPSIIPEEMTDTTTSLESGQTLAITRVMELLPHRYPFLLIDRVLEYELGKRVVALKNVSINEPFFQGHFPGYPVMPGVLVVEALAQAGAVLLGLETNSNTDRLTLLTGVDGAKFRAQVVPGDQLRLEVVVVRRRSQLARLDGKVFVEGKLVCEASLQCSTVPRTPADKRRAEQATAGERGGAAEAEPAAELVALASE